MINFDYLFDLLTNVGHKISLDTIWHKTLRTSCIKTSCKFFWMSFTTKPSEQKLQKNFNTLMNSHLQWMIYLTLYYPQNWNCCNLHAIFHSGMMDPHCQIIVTYCWWSMSCVIMLSSTHLMNINKKQVNSFKTALQQLNIGEHICILFSSMVAPYLPFWIPQKMWNSSLPNPPFYHLIPPKTQIP